VPSKAMLSEFLVVANRRPPSPWERQGFTVREVMPKGYNPLKSGARHEAIYADPTTQNVIPAKAGIQGCKLPSLALDPRFRGGDAQLLKFPTLF
jgi:hypothetical protein